MTGSSWRGSHGCDVGCIFDGREMNGERESLFTFIFSRGAGAAWREDLLYGRWPTEREPDVGGSSERSP